MLSNIANFNNIGDWFYIITATIVVDLLVIVLAKYPGKDPYFKVDSLNKWYNSFGIFAVMSDVLSLLIGIAITRYIYTALELKNPLFFLLILIVFQLLHDSLFYLGVIRQLPEGHNKMIDVFKGYANENGAKILGSDAIMLLLSVTLASLLKNSPDHATVSTLFVSLYALTYIVFTKV